MPANAIAHARGFVAGVFLDFRRDENERPFHEQSREAIEGVAHADEKGLLPFRKRQDVKSVRRDVVRGGTERDEPERARATAE